MVQRIVGLASGMDIDSMVKQLMTAEKVPLDKMKQQKQVLEWQRDDYRTINSAFLDFQTALSNMKYTTQYRVRNVTSSNENYVTATGSSTASLSSSTIQSVSKLATAATKKNNGTISGSSTNKIDPTQSLESQNFAGGSITWKTGSVETQSITAQGTNTAKIDLKGETLNLDPNYMNIEVNGKNYKVITSGTAADNEVLVDSNGNLTFNSNVAAGSVIKVDYTTQENITQQTVNKDATEIQLNIGKYTLSSVNVNGTEYTLSGDTLKDTSGNVLGTYDSATGKITNLNTTFTDDTTIEIHSTQNYSAFNLQTYGANNQINTKTFLFSGSDSLNTVMNQVNDSKVGVTMFYDSFSDQVTLTRTETGDFNTSGNEIITDDSDFMNKILKFDASSTEIGGENAKFTINGLETERNSNTFAINGVTYTLKQTFSDTPVTLSVSNDTDKVVDNIKDLVDKYNALIDTVNKKLTEERDRDYPPLTDDQREQLSDTQQEQWDAKAKSGLLRGDTILSSALTQMRTLIYQPVQNSNISSSYNQLATIGITTTANFLDGGKLQIDEDKLRAAIENDPTSVENLFRGAGDTVSSKGIVQRLYDNVTSVMNQLKEKAGNTYSTNNQFVIGRSLNDLNDQIDNFNDRLNANRGSLLYSIHSNGTSYPTIQYSSDLYPTNVC